MFYMAPTNVSPRRKKTRSYEIQFAAGAGGMGEVYRRGIRRLGSDRRHQNSSKGSAESRKFDSGFSVRRELSPLGIIRTCLRAL